RVRSERMSHTRMNADAHGNGDQGRAGAADGGVPRGLTRRGLLLPARAAALGLLSACAPGSGPGAPGASAPSAAGATQAPGAAATTPPTAAPTTSAKPATSGRVQLPTYVTPK